MQRCFIALIQLLHKCATLSFQQQLSLSITGAWFGRRWPPACLWPRVASRSTKFWRRRAAMGVPLDEERHKSSMMEQLPVDIMTNIVDVLDIPSRVKLARCNQALQQRVYRDCSKAWVRVFFSAMDRTARKRLSDVDLARLLIRFNAREVTRGLSLINCRAIMGAGLKPLRHSRVLRNIALIGTGAAMNPTPFIWHLRTMLPHELSSVVFYNACAANPSHCVLDFMQSLREAVAERAKMEKIRCDCCKQPVADESRQIVPSKFGAPEITCLWCKDSFCGRACCRIGLQECNACGYACCDECSGILRCEFGCGKSFCCIPCKHSKLDKCGGCEKVCCSDCEGLEECDYCGDGKMCITCGFHPDVCGNNCRLCGDCHSLGTCAACNDKFCINCENDSTRQCSQCLRVFCEKPSCFELWEECVACESSFCKECQSFEYCVRCDTTFCARHDRLVDCAKCDIRHCRKCGYHDPCRFCCRGCFENCSCTDEPDAKRTKLS